MPPSGGGAAMRYSTATERQSLSAHRAASRKKLASEVSFKSLASEVTHLSSGDSCLSFDHLTNADGIGLSPPVPNVTASTDPDCDLIIHQTPFLKTAASARPSPS